MPDPRHDPHRQLRELYKNLAREELLRQGREHLASDVAHRAGRARRTAWLIAGTVVATGILAALAAWGYAAWRTVDAGTAIKAGRDEQVRRALGEE